MKRKEARTYMFEFIAFARAQRRNARACADSDRHMFKAAEAEHVRIALGYRLAMRHPQSFEMKNFRLQLRIELARP